MTAVLELPTLERPPTLAPATQASLRALMGRYLGPSDVDSQIRLAESLARARAGVPDDLIGNPGDIHVVILQAQALDVGIATALSNCFWRDGKNGMTGQLMKALIMRAGHRIHQIQLTNKIAELRLERCDGQPDGTAEWRLTEAARAGLITANGYWVWWPKDCLYWRCVSRVARRYASDVTNGFYLVDELGDGLDDEAAPTVGDETVAPEVIDLLADLDTLTHPEVLALRDTATAAGLLDEYAGVVDGVRCTVADLLAHVAGERRIDGRTTAATTTTAAPPVVEQAALTCPCDITTLLRTGDHEPGCAQHVGTRA